MSVRIQGEEVKGKKPWMLLIISGLILLSGCSNQQNSINSSIQNRDQKTTNCESLKSQVRTQSQVVSSLVSELNRAQDAAINAVYSPALNQEYFAISSTYANAVRKVYTTVLIYPECFDSSQVAQFTIEEDKWWRAVNAADENWTNAANIGPNPNFEVKDPQVFSRIYP
jgi:outer membrane murein-binding lipoprotein Lpp